MKDGKLLTVQLSEDMAYAVRMLAAEADVSRGELVRRILATYLSERAERSQAGRAGAVPFEANDASKSQGVSPT